MSTPSIFFSLTADSSIQNSVLFDYDDGLAKTCVGRFVKYDFNNLGTVPAEHHGSFDMVVIDPPFITHEVWTKYADAAKLLLAPGGKVLCTTIAENAPVMESLLGVKPTVYQPSIPHLVYQYCVYTNYPSARLAEKNPEIPE
jgi:hypothetical protein